MVRCSSCGTEWTAPEGTVFPCCSACSDGYVSEELDTLARDDWAWFDSELNAKVCVYLTPLGVEIAHGDELLTEEMFEGGFRVTCSLRSLMRTFGPHLWGGEKVFEGPVRIRGLVKER